MAITSPNTQQMVAYEATENGALRRFRAPSKYDVLSGRGGSVNAHTGNVHFRNIVQERKYEYNIESSKERKAEICREVMAQVHEKGGSFLVKESSSPNAMWIELSDDRTMAKVSQALREGAPRMREAAQQGATTTSRRTSKRTRESRTGNFSKRVRVEYKGKEVHPNELSPVVSSNLSSQAPSFVPPMSLSGSIVDHEPILPNPKTFQHSNSSISLTGIMPPNEDEEFVNPFSIPELPLSQEPVQRTHSLVLSDISPNPNYLVDDFVNPFDDEDENSFKIRPIQRQVSDDSTMGGLTTLYPNAEEQEHTWQPTASYTPYSMPMQS